MNELLGTIDKPNVVESSCFLEGKEVTTSSFTKANRHYETVARQTFSYIFLNVGKHKSKHNEAHLEIGDKRLSGFLLKANRVLVCLSEKETNISNVRAHIQQVQHLIAKAEVERMLA
ncbi:hypothetical protein [Neptuniibacter sp. 2_MG-2023]|uniref:hypothetical protein n=1 Tax=Neptuniibacter sp. 2_MG-2023 TaxID=3062671 RepID=UPI0026E2CAFE|nr:hypothetical protein [Neptuniibacter sp. 2_MG-2023]MDO6513874.1 hypothetical protein [Neptuniibacter sp. 2_MG-2023]